MSKTNKPSATELAILKALWNQSPLSAKEVHQSVAEELQWSFSSTRKTLDRMKEKGYLTTQDAHGVKVYLSKVNKVSIIAGFIKDFAKRVLELDGPLPVSMFADSKLLDEKEQKELEQLLETVDEQQSEEQG